MGERQIDNGLFCSDKFRFLLDQYNRQTDYARGISEKMLALLFVFLGFYYGHLRRLPDGHGHRVLLGVTVLGSAVVVGCYVFLCARNSQRCWKSYHGLENVSHTENIELADIGIVENEPRFSVWAWCLGFMVI